MARRVFFSFQYERDIWRVNQIRNSWRFDDSTFRGRTGRRFYDASLWEKAKKESDREVERMITKGLNGTTVTAILVGERTSESDWVHYEIARSIEQGNGLLVIHIDKVRGTDGRTCKRGANPLEDKALFLFPRYDDEDRKRAIIHHWRRGAHVRLPNWIEAAAKKAGK